MLFFNGTLHEDVFMTQPPGFVDPCQPNHICKLKKTLYGLKQAPRAWYLELSCFLVRFGFKKSVVDASLFVYNMHGVMPCFLVYVDDIVLTGNNSIFLDKFVALLSNRFALKDLAPLHHFLGVEVLPISGGFFLSQSRDVSNILSEWGQSRCHTNGHLLHSGQS